MDKKTFRFATVVAILLALPLVLYTVVPGGAYGQATISAGSISGTVVDSTGAVLAGARVLITNNDTGQVIERATSSSGAYNVGGLQPGSYLVRVESKGFRSQESRVTVQVGVTQTVNATLSVGPETQTVEVSSTAVAVDTEQATVSGVLNTQQIENLPVNGRNFLDLAQLEPGVQIQDGGTFDPTKNGMSSVSFGGKAGRTARITVDGIDISDENVGTTTQNVSAGAISEFQLSQSTLDLSTELTSSGSVNVVTKSGTNNIHGDGFYLFRDKRAGFAAFPGDCDANGCQQGYYQRNQYGGSIGGPLVKNKFFWFMNAERVKQDQLVPVIGTFNSAGYGSPFRDTTVFGRMDWVATQNIKVFYKFNYNWDVATRSDAATFQPFANKNNTPSHGIGVDFTHGSWTQSLRYGYVYFSNQIADAVAGNPGLYDPVRPFGIALRIGGAGVPDRFGPNRLAPQQTFQRNNQLKYDASKLFGRHLIRFGADFNHILGGGQAAFYTTPELRTRATAVAPGGDPNNPLDYIVGGFIVANGIGFATEKPGFNLPGGGLADNRFGFYVGDSWKIKPNLTLTYGVRYIRDTGRAPTDLAAITCDQLDPAAFTTGQLPCSGSTDLLSQWGPQFAGRVRQPNNNWGPQLGIAWDPRGNGKTVIRAGGGIYYENNVWNNILFDRGLRLTSGLFNFVQGGSTVCSTDPSVQVAGVSGTVLTFPFNGGTGNIATDICGRKVSDAAPALAALQGFLIGQQAVAGAQANPQFVGESLSFTNMVAPKYQTPYSYQMNIGVSHQLKQNMILSADFIRNISLHFLINYDQNAVGSAQFLDANAAASAIARTLSKCGVATIDDAIASCPGIHSSGAGATIADFAANRLNAGPGVPFSAFGLASADVGYAFPGKNPLLGAGSFLVPQGRSTYTALQLKLQHNMTDPIRGLSGLNYQVAYSFSRLNSMIGSDQDFAGTSLDALNPGRYYGPSSLDRTHQFSFGGSFQVHRGPQLSLIAHAFSPLAITPLLATDAFGAPGEIFRTDVTGDGTVGDVLPGANIGSYGRSYNGSGINGTIQAYNANFAGKLTPAGQALVNAGLFTTQQLVSLGAVMPTMPLAPNDQVGMGWLKTFDVRLQWPIKINERVSLRPSFSVYNLFNQANISSSFQGPSAANLVGILDQGSTSINGLGQSLFTGATARGDFLAAQSPLRTSIGTGVNTMGAPRQMEFGLKVVF